MTVGKGYYTKILLEKINNHFYTNNDELLAKHLLKVMILEMTESFLRDGFSIEEFARYVGEISISDQFKPAWSIIKDKQWVIDHPNRNETSIITEEGLVVTNSISLGEIIDQ